MKQWVFVGIDQTGAVRKNGSPKPLPACYIRNNHPHFFYLPTLSKNLLQQATQIDAKEEIIIGLDCVLGLPEALCKNISPREAMERTKNFPGYGRAVAKDFFEQLSPSDKPRRKIEARLGANSIFQDKPYQKNIQTGTFRCWKELALAGDDFCFPAIEPIENQPTNTAIKVFEGYPSFSWKKLLGTKTRDVNQLSSLIKQCFPEISWRAEHQAAIQKDANLADAFLLALAIREDLEQALNIQPHHEGWILGSDFS